MKNSKILTLILLVASHGIHASHEQPAKLYEMEHENWYGTCSKKRCPNPFDDLMFEDNDQIQLHGGSCQEWINHKNKWGDIFFNKAMKENNIRRVEKLIELGTEVHQQDEYGRTLLYCAIYSKNEQIVQLLIANGANVNQRSNDGYTPLYWAIDSNNPESIKLLLAAGADTTIRNRNYVTPLYWAVKFNKHEAIQLLLAAGADTTITNNEGRTARELITDQITRSIFDEVAVTPADQINSYCSIS